MPLTIDLSGTKQHGVDFNAFLEEHFDGFAPFGFPWFFPEDGAQTDQIMHVDTPEDGQEDKARVVLLDGEDFLYTFANHSVSGLIDTIRLGTLGDAWNPDTGEFNLENGLMTDMDTTVTISGLEIDNPAGVRGDVHEIVRGMMGGGHDGLLADPAPMLSHLFATGHNVTGSAGADAWKGTKFKDTAAGGKGRDQLDGKNGADSLSGAAGNDILKGGKGADMLAGGGGKDSLYGGSGKDTLEGQSGADISTGGKGADVFKFTTAGHAKNDTITDFRSKQGDKIDLSAISNDWQFIAEEDFSNSAGELRSWQSKGKTYVAGDIDGDGSHDFRIKLTGEINLNAGDFIF